MDDDKNEKTQIRAEPGLPDPGSLTAYQVLASRRAGYDTLIWQTPVLGLTAQAFLFTVALSHESSRTARFIAASLALVTSVISIQLMAKHRHHERLDSEALQHFESEHNLPPLHKPPEERAEELGWKRNLLVRWRSYVVWAVGLAVFGAAAVMILVINCAKPELL